MFGRNILIGIGMLFISISCSHNSSISHVGSKYLDRRICELDSIIISADSTSGRGNFYMLDSFIYFADSYYNSIFQYSALDGTYLLRHFTTGQGPNELSSLLYAYPFKNRQKECFIIDNSMRMYTYNSNDNSLLDRGVINFGWDDVKKGNYDSPTVYNVMEMTDFGIDFTYLNDSTLLVPLSLVNRYLDGVNAKRYEQGHLLGELNINSMRIERLIGDFPVIYKQKPLPFFEFFHYALNQDTLYINHAIDSLIYVYKYPDQLLYTMGYEVKNINRDYSVGYDVDISHFKKDIEKVGANTNLIYVAEENLLIKTALESFSNKHVYMQVYAKSDLVLEEKMPDFFKLIGYFNGYYYGVRMIPIEKEDGDISFIFYRFKIE